MTTLSDLARLARAATQSEDWGHDDCFLCDAAKEFHAALSPERILAMIAAIEAEKAMYDIENTFRCAQTRQFEIALAALEGDK